jgi:branched-chain amino acid aminotransferase
MMDMPFSIEQVIDSTKELIKRNELDSCYVRPLVYHGFGPMGVNPLPSPVHISIITWPWGAYLGEDSFTKGVDVMISSWVRYDHNQIPPAAKATGQYLNGGLAKMEAIKAGYAEGILLNPHGYVSDGSGENVFIVKGDTLFTPPVYAGPLEGITRHSIMTIARDLGFEVEERDLTRTDLYLADEAFFTGTAAEVVPIRSVDDRVIGDPGEVTKKIQEVFFATVKGEVERYSDWNELVS